eukprot:COSAG05_NODE_2752_length_2684_cov_3.365571_1_plen_528_part_10
MWALWALTSASPAALSCPVGLVQVDTFELNGTGWAACEDLQRRRNSALALASADGRVVEWFAQGYEPYTQGSDEEYYLNMTKRAVMSDKADILAVKLLNNYSHISYDLVKRAVPPMVHTGVRTFIGSRASSVDTSLSDLGEDASNYGFPSISSYVINQTAIAAGEPPIEDIRKHINESFVADGQVGGHLPIVRFSFPVSSQSPYLPEGTSGQRHWDMIAAGVPDMKGSREQGVWFRFQQIGCADDGSSCKLVGKPQYYDTYWWATAPDGQTGINGPELSASPSGFYANLLEVRTWWEEELDKEQMMKLSLPSPATTNGTYLSTQSIASVIKAMITRKGTWHPRYGVNPGYGINMQDGFQDTFTTTAQAALEQGAELWARGLINHQFRHYVRLDGMIHYRGEEIAQSARMLTILALCHSYSICDDGFMLELFDHAKSLAGWLIGRRSLSLGWPKDDPRYGMLPGDDEADNYNRLYYHQDVPLHFFSSNAESYRAFAEMGAVWTKVGKAASRDDVRAHGAELLKIAPELY